MAKITEGLWVVGGGTGFSGGPDVIKDRWGVRGQQAELLQGLIQEIASAGKELQDLVIRRVQYYAWASQVAQW